MDDEWVDPQYAEVIEFYREKREANPPPRRPGRRERPYGDSFVIVVDPASASSFVASR